MGLAATLETIRKTIEDVKKNSPLASPHPLIMGASKGQDASRILEAVDAGLSCFGENRVQEAEAKFPAIRERFPGVRLHLIGPLQTNKVRQAVALFDAIQTVDRARLADALKEEMAKTGRTVPCFIQVNTGKEPQKAGVAPEEAEALAAHCLAIGLPVAGLMCVPPHGQPPAPHFAMLREMARTLGLAELSMGMSDDYEAALRMGSTCIRLGRILFGERPPASGKDAA